MSRLKETDKQKNEHNEAEMFILSGRENVQG